MVFGVKKYVIKKGKRYGPYPKDDTYYLYKTERKDGKIVTTYLGRGPLPKGANSLVKEEEKKITESEESDCSSWWVRMLWGK